MGWSVSQVLCPSVFALFLGATYWHGNIHDLGCIGSVVSVWLGRVRSLHFTLCFLEHHARTTCPELASTAFSGNFWACCWSRRAIRDLHSDGCVFYCKPNMDSGWHAYDLTLGAGCSSTLSSGMVFVGSRTERSCVDSTTDLACRGTRTQFVGSQR